MMVLDIDVEALKQWALESIVKCKEDEVNNLENSLDLYTWYYIKGKEDAYEEFLVKLDFLKF